MKMKPILDTCQNFIENRNHPVDWSDLRDMIDVETGGELPPSTLDTTTQLLLNRLVKKTPHLLKG